MNFIQLTFFALFFLSACSATKHTDPLPEHETFQINSKSVGETRVINVWTPANYKSGKDSFPVLYMADGGIKEDFPHVANTISQMIQQKKIIPVILVGIENTQRRRDLSGPTEVAKDKEIAPVVAGSEKFRAFINDELFPEINKRYRVLDKNGIIGESLAGLFVMETLFTKPDMFDFYIAFDPSLWWNNHYLVRTAKEHLSALPATEKKLWFAGSDATDISAYTKELAEIFKAANLKNLTWTYSDEPREKHNTIFRATKEKALEWVLNGK